VEKVAAAVMAVERVVAVAVAEKVLEAGRAQLAILLAAADQMRRREASKRFVVSVRAV
jgi:hypothetical protein